MLKSLAPSRRVGRNLKRQKTTKAGGGSDDQTSTAAASGSLGRLHGTAGAPARVSRSPTPTAVKVSVDGGESCSKPQKHPRRGSQYERFEGTTNSISIEDGDPSGGSRGGRREEAGAAQGGLANSFAAAKNDRSATRGVAVGPVRRVKVKGHKRAATTTPSHSGDIEWRVPSRSDKPPPPPRPPPPPPISSRKCELNSNDSSSSNSSSSSSTGNRGSPRKKHASLAVPHMVPATRPSALRSNGSTSTSSGSGGSIATSRRGSLRNKFTPLTALAAAAADAEAARGIGGSNTYGSGSRSDSNTCNRASPRKKLASATPATTKDAVEEEEEELPPCPYPGRKNVSWACRACDGARHHLTSRSAMEPLQRAHGFKVQRVPNDGDCFFSSIEAALSDRVPVDRARGRATAGTGAPATGVPARGELTVAKMREWVAEETGQEQLEFYILQAGANPEDRWLDFVRPLEDRIPSDDEDEEDEEEEGGGDDGDGSYRDETESVASSGPKSQSQSQPLKPQPKASSASRRSVSREAASRNPEESGSVKGEGGAGAGAVKSKGKRSDERLKGGAPSSNGDRGGNGADGGSLAGVSSSSSSSDRNARRIGRRRNGGKGMSAVEKSTPVATAAAAAAAAVAAARTKSSRQKPSPSEQSNSGTAAASTAASASRKSSRLRTVNEWRVDQDTGGRGGEEEAEAEEKGEVGGEGESREKDEQSEGLPVVTTVEELRRFVRLEGSVVGHGNCMWADTFAHHVVSRRLKITILFIDMEREKSAWPYRVLARTATDSDDEEEERFVVLKREPSHFVLVRTAPPPEDKKGATPSDGGGGSGGAGGGNGGVAATRRKGGGGQACFSRSELPDVVRRLWQL